MGVILGAWAEFAQALVAILMGIWIVRFLYRRRIFLRL